MDIFPCLLQFFCVCFLHVSDAPWHFPFPFLYYTLHFLPLPFAPPFRHCHPPLHLHHFISFSFYTLCITFAVTFHLSLPSSSFFYFLDLFAPPSQPPSFLLHYTISCISLCISLNVLSSRHQSPRFSLFLFLPLPIVLVPRSSCHPALHSLRLFFAIVSSVFSLTTESLPLVSFLLLLPFSVTLLRFPL